MKKVFYDYQTFIQDVKEIGDNVSDDVDSIIAISRGGLTLAHFLGEYLNLRQVYAINTISYNGDQKLDNIKIFGVPNLADSKNVIVVDDISDSGRTLKTTIQTLKNSYPKINFSTATIFYNEKTIFKPDIYIRKSDKWIDFFWEKF